MPVVRVSSGTEASEFLKKHSVFAVGLFEKFGVCAFEPLLEFLHDVLLNKPDSSINWKIFTLMYF